MRGECAILQWCIESAKRVRRGAAREKERETRTCAPAPRRGASTSSSSLPLPSPTGIEFLKSRGQHILKNPMVVQAIVDKGDQK